MQIACAIPLAIALVLSSAQAQQLEVVFFDVGQGDSTLVIGPTGRTFLIDGGLENKGNSVILPELNARGISHLDFVSATHYHADHIGGLDEVWQGGIQTTVAFDRGDKHTPTTQSFQDYQNTYASVRQTVNAGEVLDLGGGATATCIAVDGKLSNGMDINLRGTVQQENSASIAWLIEYQDFDFLIAGDLTGLSANSADVETPVGKIIGDVDVYQVNAHGASISSSQGLLDFIQPEFAVVSCEGPNQFNFPRQDVVDRLNIIERVIPVWCTTSGNQAFGYVHARGTIQLSSNGNRYTVKSTTGASFTALCDERHVFQGSPGELVISEFHRNPSAATDFYAEWIELTATRINPPIGLLGMKLQNSAGQSITLGINILLEAGDRVLFAADGQPSRNGDLMPTLAWPILSLTIADDLGSLLVLDSQDNEIDRIDYDPSWPGGDGISTERKDLLGESLISNFSAGSTVFGAGDLGSPGAANVADITDWRPGGDTWVEVTLPPFLNNPMEMLLHMPSEQGKYYQGCVAFGTEPGTDLGNIHLPLNQDFLYNLSRNFPGWRGLVPTTEEQAVGFFVPNDLNLEGRLIFGFVATYDATGVRTWSNPVPMLIRR
jgi:beta-lactamase superfamily II metal-dependent hydrolase